MRRFLVSILYVLVRVHRQAQIDLVFDQENIPSSEFCTSRKRISVVTVCLRNTDLYYRTPYSQFENDKVHFLDENSK